MPLYVIINPERTFNKKRPYFWKANKCGYTQNPLEAGRYTKKEVDDICNQPFVDDYGVPEDEIGEIYEH